MTSPLLTAEATCTASTAQMAVAERSAYQAMISELVVPQLDVQFASVLINLICIQHVSCQTCAMH